MDRTLAFQAGNRGFNSPWGHALLHGKESKEMEFSTRKILTAAEKIHIPLPLIIHAYRLARPVIPRSIRGTCSQACTDCSTYGLQVAKVNPGPVAIELITNYMTSCGGPSSLGSGPLAYNDQCPK